MPQIFSNNSTSTISAGLLIGDTTLFIQPGQGGRFPVVVAPDFSAGTLEDASGNIEVVKVTAHAANSTAFTVVRAQQGTAARAYAIGDLFEMRMTALEATTWEADIDGLQTSRVLKAGDAYTGAHDFSGASSVSLPANTLIGSVSALEVAALDGISANVQSQLDAEFLARANADNLRALKAGSTYTGTHDFSGAALQVVTRPAGTNDNSPASMSALLQAVFASFANLPGDPGDAVPRALQTLLGAKAWLPMVTALDGQAGPLTLKTLNGGSLLGSGDIVIRGVSQVTLVTNTNTTLTSAPTLVQCNPTNFGLTLTLPDATTCNLGGPLHIIDNRSIFPVRLINQAGVMIGLVPGESNSYIALNDKTTAAGVWDASDIIVQGVTARLATAQFNNGFASVIDLGGGREFLQGRNSSNVNYGVVYNRLTNQFGPVTILRATAAQRSACILQTTDRVLMVSAGTTDFEAVVLSITGLNIVPNAAVAVTLSASISGFIPSTPLISCNGAFVCGYFVPSNEYQIRSIAVTGTVPAISTAVILLGTNLQTATLFASGTVCVAASFQAGVSINITPYTISGSNAPLIGTNLTGGTLTGSNVQILKIFPLGPRWCLIYKISTGVNAMLLSLSGTTITGSTDANLLGIPNVLDAMVIGSNKVFLPSSSGTVGLITDTAGTPSLASLAGQPFATQVPAYVEGTNAYVFLDQNGTLAGYDCSGAAPVLIYSEQTATAVVAESPAALAYASSITLRLPPEMLYGATYAALARSTSTAVHPSVMYASQGRALLRPRYSVAGERASASINGLTPSQRWGFLSSGATTELVKLECIP